MTPLLAYAEGPDTSNSSLTIVVIALVIVAVVCVLAAIPIATARRRRLGNIEGIAAIIVLWGLALAGTAIYAINAQMNWAKQHDINVRSGYSSNSRDESDRPNLLLFSAGWAACAALYIGAIVWSATAKPFTPAAPPAGFDVINPSPPAEPRD